MRLPFTPPRLAPFLPALLAMATASFGAGGKAPSDHAIAVKRELSPGQVDFCHIVYGCKLAYPPGFCPDAKQLPPASFSFDDTRCLEARTLQSRGVGPNHPTYGYPLYRFLGMEYRVIYEITDTIQVSPQRLEYMLNDLPLAARLVSHYQNTPYTAEYLDAGHTQFQGTKGKHLRGGAQLISGSTTERHLFYFGTGIADVAFWTLKGPALMDFTYWQIPGKPRMSGYKMKILVFPGNNIVDKIMNMGLFRKIVFSKIREVLDDITQTARKLEASGGSDLMKEPNWSPADRQKIMAFFKIP